MAITSFPWASVGGDRPVSDTMDAAYYAAVHGNIVLNGLQPTVSGTNVSVSAGTAVVQGRVVTVDAPVTLTPTVNRRARIVLRLDLTNRTAEVALSGTTTSYPSLTRNGSTWEMGLGTADTTGALAVTDTRADFDLCGMYDTGRVDGLITVAPGWSLQSSHLRRVGNIVFVRVSVVRTGGTITVPADGDIPNTTIASVPAQWTPVLLSSIGPANDGRLAGGTINTAGNIVLTSVSAGAHIVNGDAISLGGSYVLN